MLSAAKEALDALSRHTGLGMLAFGRDRICSLEVGESLAVEIEDMAESNALRLNATLREMGDADFGVLRELLVANFNGAGTGNAAISVNPANGEFVLTQAIQLRHHTEASFIQETETFIKYALFWENRMASLRPRPTKIEAIPADDSLITLRL